MGIFGQRPKGPQLHEKTLATKNHIKFQKAEVIKSISPIAWRHVNLLGRFEFQRPQNSLDIDELIKTLKQEIVWQKQKSTDEQLE
ncbi:hypothetical protein C5S42_00165 [Candidatus Methanomarinus sp.]|nr:hypothetical protein C5S42_00165 [ANME-2 cluster archaeon]